MATRFGSIGERQSADIPSYRGNGMTVSFLAAKMLINLYQQRDKGRHARQIGNLFAFDRARR